MYFAQIYISPSLRSIWLYFRAYLSAPNMVKRGIPEKILQNAVQTHWPCVNRTPQSKVTIKSHFFPSSNVDMFVQKTFSIGLMTKNQRSAIAISQFFVRNGLVYNQVVIELSRSNWYKYAFCIFWFWGPFLVNCVKYVNVKINVNVTLKVQ